MSLVNGISSTSFAQTGNSASTAGQKDGAIDDLQEKVQRTQQEIKNLADSDMEPEIKMKLIQGKQSQVSNYKSQIAAIQTQQMQKSMIKEMEREQVEAAVKSSPIEISRSVVNHIEKDRFSENSTLDSASVVVATEGKKVAENQRGPLRAISEYI